MMAQASKQHSHIIMQNGIKLVMSCATRQKSTGFAKRLLKSKPQQQVVRHLKVGSGERFLPHLTKVLKKYQCVSFVMPQWSKIITKLLPRSLIQMCTKWPLNFITGKAIMIATDAVYHKHCLTGIFTRYRSSMRQKQSSFGNSKLKCEAIALAELISYVEEIRQTKSIIKLSDIVQLYKSRLEQLGGDISQRINATRLKEAVLAQIPDLEAHKSNYEVVLSFKMDTGSTLLEATKRDHDSEAVVLMRAAEIIRKEIFQTQYIFEGSLLDEQYDNNPSSLVALVQMILGGTNIENQTDNNEDVKSAALSITQLLVFNAMKYSRKNGSAVRHNLDRETRLPLYLGLLVHNITRKRDLIDKLFERGLSVSYDRVFQLSTDVANAVIDQFEDDGQQS